MSVFSCASISVETLSGLELTFGSMDLSTYVVSVKSEIQYRTAISIDEQRLIFGADILDNGKTLGDCNITDGSKLQLVVEFNEVGVAEKLCMVCGMPHQWATWVKACRRCNLHQDMMLQEAETKKRKESKQQSPCSSDSDQ